jgi:hypothetical protein
MEQMPVKGTARRSFSAARELIEVPGGFVEVKATADGQVQVVLAGAYRLESMYRGGPASPESTILTLIPDKKVKV